MIKMKIITVVFMFFSVVITSCKKEELMENKVELITNQEEKRVDVLVDGKLFTSYLYTGNLPVLKKTTLYPVIAANGATVTRGYPLQPRPGERTDHPHHIGVWFNYGDVNGLDFWNNSDAIPAEKANEMGTIRHQDIIDVKSGDGKGELTVAMNWLKPDSTVLLKEKTTFAFLASKGIRIIDRISTLTAQDDSVLFRDNKEGMFAIRVARQLELPSDKPVALSDAHGNVTDVPALDNSGVTGNYLNSEGIIGEDVWAKRAGWVKLSGTVDGKDVTLVIFDNPENVGYPAYWHARGYGLFSVNPLGQKIFSEGKEELNYSLKPGESVTFKYRLLIYDGDIDKNIIEKDYQEYKSGQ